VATYFSDPLEVLDYVHDFLDKRKDDIGLAFCGYGEERLIPEYPAIIVTAGPVSREIHGTHKFRVTFILELWIYHAKLSESHRMRTRKDLQFATSVRQLLHDNMRLYADIDDPNPSDPQIAGGWITSEDPAFINRGKGEGVVATRMEWTGISEATFK